MDLGNYLIVITENSSKIILLVVCRDNEIDFLENRCKDVNRYSYKVRENLQKAKHCNTCLSGSPSYRRSWWLQDLVKLQSSILRALKKE